MEQFGASCMSLHDLDDNSNDKQRKESKPLVGSLKSISKYEDTSLKCLYPQIIATAVSAAFHLGNGISLAYSAILIAQLSQPDTEIPLTTSQKSWIASVLIIVIPFSSVFGGIFMDNLGRLNCIKIAGIPGVLGWVMIALAKNVTWIIVGRLLVGISSAWGTSPGIVYITEIASSHIRGPLMSTAPVYVSIGMCLTYLLGWYLTWRTLAWICIFFIVAPCVMCCFIPESPEWLILKNKLEAAKKSLNWFHKYQPKIPESDKTYSELMFLQIQEDQKKKKDEEAQRGIKGFKSIVKEFTAPTAYKPMLFCTGFFIFQHFSGIYITMFYSITFIEEAGTTLNPYMVSILIGFIRLFMSILSTYLLKRFDRRPLIFVSCMGMAICMLISGWFTKNIQEGSTTMTWVPVFAILLYVIMSIVGLLPIPTMLIAELFPLAIRGVAYSVGYSLGCGFMFLALQNYFTMSQFFGGAAHLQWFFAAISLAGMVYAYIFMPETNGVKLNDISDYFKNHFIYLGTNIKKSTDDDDVNV